LYAVCSLEKIICLAAVRHGDSKAGNFSSAVCSPTRKVGKEQNPVFCPHRKQWVAKRKISIYIAKVIFLKERSENF
jgi:hypothetical protein